MLKEKPGRLKVVGLRAESALRTSIDFIAESRQLQQNGAMQSLSESCNFADRSSLQDRTFKKAERMSVLRVSTENLSPNLKHELSCLNHQSKNAQFCVTTDDDQMYYCERCAISLASQGFNVCRIDEQPELKRVKQNARPIEVDFLLDHIGLIRENLNKKHTQSVKKQHSNRQLMDKLQQELGSHFRQLEDLLQDVKKKTMQEFHKEREQFLGSEQSAEPVYLDAVRDLDVIAQEIRTLADGQSGKQKLAAYRTRLETYRKILGDASEDPSKPLLRYKSVSSLTQPLRDLLQVQFNIQPKSQLFSFCKSTASSVADGRQPARAVSHFGCS